MNELASSDPGPRDIDAPSSAPTVDAPASAPIEREASDPGPRDIDTPSYSDGDPRASLAEPVSPDLLRPAEAPPPPDIPAPKAWSKQDKEIWASLPAETRQRIAENESRREAHWNSQRSEIDRARHEAIAAAEQQLGPERERVRQQQELARLPIEVATAVQQRDAALTEFKTRYPDLQDASFADQYHGMLLQQDSNKAAQFVSDIHELAKIASDTELVTFKAQQEQARLEAEQRQAYSKQLADYHASQDAAFAAKHKEFADPQRAAEITAKTVMPFLREGLGLSPERIQQLWHGEPLFRSAEAQSMLLYAARGYQAERAARNAVPTMRKPQSPGVSNGADGDDLLSRAAARGDMQTYTKLRASGKVR
jgi:hypothetical protein